MVAYKDKNGEVTACFNEDYWVDKNNKLWWQHGEAWNYSTDVPNCLKEAMGKRISIGFYLVDDENGEVAIGNSGNGQGYDISFKNNIVTKYPPLFIGEFSCYYDHIREEVMDNGWNSYKKVCTLPKKGEIRHYRIERYHYND